MSSDYSESQVKRARTYIEVRESQGVVRIGDQGDAHPAASQLIDAVANPKRRQAVGVELVKRGHSGRCASSATRVVQSSLIRRFKESRHCCSAFGGA
jgi:hypothetical protein